MIWATTTSIHISNNIPTPSRQDYFVCLFFLHYGEGDHVPVEHYANRPIGTSSRSHLQKIMNRWLSFLELSFVNLYKYSKYVGYNIFTELQYLIYFLTRWIRRRLLIMTVQKNVFGFIITNLSWWTGQGITKILKTLVSLACIHLIWNTRFYVQKYTIWYRLHHTQITEKVFTDIAIDC